MPVHYHVHAALLCPFNALVHCLECAFPAHGVDVLRMHGKPYHVCSPLGGFIKITLVPLAFANQFYRIGETEPAEYNLLTIWVYELVSIYFNPAVTCRA